MIEFIAHLVITSGLFLLVARVVRGIEIDGWGSALIAAIVFGVVNAFVRPYMVMLTTPITRVSLGLFLLVINAGVLWLVAAIAPGFRIKSFGPAVVGSLVLTFMSLGLTILMKALA